MDINAIHSTADPQIMKKVGEAAEDGKYHEETLET
jgi:hypothetical protein